MNEISKKLSKLETKINTLRIDEENLLEPEERTRFDELSAIRKERMYTESELRERSRLMFNLQRRGFFSKPLRNLAERLKKAREQRYPAKKI